jgi:tetratricopeptide (TPR) repeat protein
MRLGVLICFLAASGLAQTRSSEPPPREAMGTDARITAASRALKASPENSRAACQLALAFIRKMRETVDGQYLDRAASLVNDVLARDPADYEALRLRTEIAMEKHEFARVAEYSEEMTRFAADDPGAWGFLGDALMELGQYRRAGEAYARMIALKPALASFNRVAWHRFVTGDAKAAIELMNAAIQAGSKLPDDMAWCLADLAGIYWKTGAVEGSEQAYRRALTYSPNYYPAWAGMGRIASARNQVKQAIAAYLHAQAIVPLPDFAAALEELYIRAGDTAKARGQRALLDSAAITLRASGEKANRMLALIYADTGQQLDRAEELTANELDARPDVYSWDARAWVLFHQNELDEAWSAAQNALRFGTAEPAFHYHAGMIARAMGRKEDAQRELRAALALNPNWNYAQAREARAALDINGSEAPANLSQQ